MTVHLISAVILSEDLFLLAWLLILSIIIPLSLSLISFHWFAHDVNMSVYIHVHIQVLVWYKFWFSVVFCTCVPCLIKWDLCLLSSGQMALRSSEVIAWLGLHLVSHFLRGKYGPSSTLPSVWVYTNHSWNMVNLNIPGLYASSYRC